MMVGRQNVNAPMDVTTSILDAIGIPAEQSSVILPGQFAEPLFALLGARQVSSVDASDYEQATQILGKAGATKGYPQHVLCKIDPI